jgi:hypothetical protein
MELKQITQKLKKELSNWDFEKAIKFSGGNESQTRDFLIEPFFNKILGYNPMDDYLHEYSIKVGQSNKKVDMAITISGNTPDILVECKASNSKLSSAFGQLNEYCLYQKQVKIGILTSGIEYRFYSRSQDSNEILHDSPFFIFDLRDYDDSDIEYLAQFYKLNVNLSTILEDAEEIHFLDKFNEAFYNVLAQKEDGLIKLIFNEMGGKRISPNISKKIYKLINSISLEQTLEKIKAKESADNKRGIVTTSDEIKAYNIIKTILSLSSKFKEDIERVTFIDYKEHFSIVLDDNKFNVICKIETKGNSIKLKIWGGDEYTLNQVTVAELTKYKNQIVDAAIKAIES